MFGHTCFTLQVWRPPPNLQPSRARHTYTTTAKFKHMQQAVIHLLGAGFPAAAVASAAAAAAWLAPGAGHSGGHMSPNANSAASSCRGPCLGGGGGTAPASPCNSSQRTVAVLQLLHLLCGARHMYGCCVKPACLVWEATGRGTKRADAASSYKQATQNVE
jgi:hypothetical protein